MKRISSIIIAFVCLSGINTFCFGDNNDRTDINIYRHGPGPKDTGVTGFTSYYENDTLYLQFDEPEGIATITLTNLEACSSLTTSFMTDQPFSLFIGTAPATYIIEITTSTGNCYNATLTTF